MSEYWDEDGPGLGAGGVVARDDDDDDEVETRDKGTPRARDAGGKGGSAGLDLDAHVPAKGRLMTLDEETGGGDMQVMMLAMEVVNTQVDRQKLSDSSLMKFVTKIASSAPANSKEKRRMVVLASAEFSPRVTPNEKSMEFTEVGRTDTSIDDPSPTFSLPVRVTCRKGTERLVRIQLLWSQSGMLGGGDTVLGHVTERFSDLFTKTANLQPITFAMALASACPRGRGLIWRVPMQSLHPPSSPFVAVASKRHVSFSVSYVFRKSKDNGSTGSADQAKPPRRSSKPSTTDDGGAALAERSTPELMLAKENTIESRFSYRVPSLFFRPLVKQLEAAVLAWNQRYEVERVQQGYFTSDAEAFAHGRVLVRLSVIEASGLPLYRNEDVGKEDYYSGVNSGRSLNIPSVSTGSAFAQKLVRSKSPERGLNSNPFVAVILEKPLPQLGRLIGHTNTEYSTQNPVFGQNTNVKLCPHSRSRESFSVCSSTRLGRSPGIESPSFLFYAHAHHVGQTNIRLDVCHEAYTLQGGTSVQLGASGSLQLDASYVATSDLDETRDREVWLPLTDKEGKAAGRLLVRLSVFEGDGEGLDPVQVAAKAAYVSPETYRPCYEWMSLTGLSGRMPREGDIFSETPTDLAKAKEGRLELHYPPEWIKAHINSLNQQLQWLQSSLRLWEQATAEGRGFRSSDLKVTPELQGVPINLHSQTFVVSDCRELMSSTSSITSSSVTSPAPQQQQQPPTPQDDLLSFDTTTAAAGGSIASPAPTSSTGGSRPLFIYDLVSTGAPTAHSLGFRRGGLLSLQTELASAQRDMLQVDEQLKAKGVCLPTGPSGELANRLLSDLLKFEAIAAKIAVRRALVISQALTVAVTSLATKLDVMLTEDADQSLVSRAAINMVQAGYLVCFQGLVSTIGKEQGMQEDVATAMELASLYSFEIRARKIGQLQSPIMLPVRSPAPAPPPPPPPPASDDLLDFMSAAPPPLPPTRSPAILSPPPFGEPTSPTKSDSLGLDVEFDHAGKRVRLYLDPAAMERLPKVLQPQSPTEPVVFPIVAILFAQGIDAKQTIANLSNQIKPGASTNVGGNSTLQPIINRRSLRVLNDYVHRCYPVQSAGPKARFDRLTCRLEAGRATSYGSSDEFARSIDEISIHPMLEALKEAVKRDNGSFKNVDLLRDQERVVLQVGGGQVIFCKSGKDRTGMAVTLHQARILADRHGTGQAMDRVVHDANVMRLYGTRLLICEKNVGRLKYAFNALQLQFMPSEYRPPTETIEDMVNSILFRDTT